MRDLQVKPGDALIVVDVQRDFLPGGSLAVPRGDEVVSVLNEYLRCFVSQGLSVIATRDWHPADHCSFRERGGDLDKDGSITDTKIVRDIGAGFGSAAESVVNGMNNMGQKWVPGKQRGRPVRVPYTLPVKFKLEG